MKATEKIDFFANLGFETHYACCQYLRHFSAKENQVIFNEGMNCI
jgi:hypothetical protein